MLYFDEIKQKIIERHYSTAISNSVCMQFDGDFNNPSFSFIKDIEEKGLLRCDFLFKTNKFFYIFTDLVAKKLLKNKDTEYGHFGSFLFLNQYNWNDGNARSRMVIFNLKTGKVIYQCEFE